MNSEDSLPNTEEKKVMVGGAIQSTSSIHAPPVGALDESMRRFIRGIADRERIDMEKWLSTLDKLYDEWNYSSAQRIAYTMPILNEEQQLWYEQHKEEIQDNWKFFCEQLKLNAVNLKPTQTVTQSTESTASNGPEAITLEEVIDTKFEKYSGVGDPKRWLLYTMNQFKTCGLRREDQFDAIPLLLEGDAYIWYVENSEAISNFELFSKLFLQQFKLAEPKQTSSTRDTIAQAVTVSDNLSTSHLQRTVGDDIIKRPTYFRGSQDDVHDWLDKLEQRFTMAQWSDENKLHYIAIHLQDDAYRWWMQTSSTIKAWSLFKDAVIRAFGSTRIQELAFEQLKWYKQTVNQTISQYHDKIIELCKKVDPAMPDTLKLKYLMGGIRESLKPHVALQDPKTTEAFLTLARKVEDVFPSTAVGNEFIPKEPTLNVTAYQSQPNRRNSQYTNPTQTRPMHYQKTSSGNNAYQATQPIESSYPRNKYSNNRGYSYVDHRRCFQCGQRGHLQRNCSHHFKRVIGTVEDGFVPTYKKNPSSPLIVQLPVNNHLVYAMVDTGSATSIIHIDTLKELGYQSRINYSEKLYRTANNGQFHTIGFVKLKIKMRKLITFIVAQIALDLCTELVLGNDWIQQNDIDIISSEKKIRKRHGNYTATLPFSTHHRANFIMPVIQIHDLPDESLKELNGRTVENDIASAPMVSMSNSSSSLVDQRRETKSSNGLHCRSCEIKSSSKKNEIKNLNLQKLSKILTCSDSDIEPISSNEEIYLNQLIKPVVNECHVEDQFNNYNVPQDIIKKTDDDGVELEIGVPSADVTMNDINDDTGVRSVDGHIVMVSEVDDPPEQQQERKRKRRSEQGTKRRNKRRNDKLKSIRFKFYFTRPYYYRFKSRTLRKVLQHYGVEFQHIKKVRDRVVIGLKCEEDRHDYEQALPHNCFNKKNYEQFRR